MDTNMVQVGQRVHCILYGGEDGIIYAITGEQQPETVRSLAGRGCVVMGGRATFDVVFENGAISRGIPESIVRGVQWRIKPELATAEEITRLLSQANTKNELRQLEAIQEATRQQDERQRIKAAYPYLEQQDGSKKSSHALGAANLRKELARTFPGVSFRVHSESYSGGNSIHVKWTDGPTTEQVKPITDKYQEGNFDGMTDSYTYDHDHVWPDVFGGARYVMENRSDSLAGIRQAWVNAGYPLEDVATTTDPRTGQEEWDRWQSRNGDQIFRAWATTDLRTQEDGR